MVDWLEFIKIAANIITSLGAAILVWFLTQLNSQVKELSARQHEMRLEVIQEYVRGSMCEAFREALREDMRRMEEDADKKFSELFSQMRNQGHMLMRMHGKLINGDKK